MTPNLSFKPTGFFVRCLAGSSLQNPGGLTQTLGLKSPGALTPSTTAMHPIFERLAPIASLNAQRRRVASATHVDAFLLSTLLDEALHVSLSARSDPEVRDTLGPDAFGALMYLGLLLAAVDLEGPRVSPTEVIERDPGWIAVRDQARHCLDLLGFDLAEWERSNGLYVA